MSKTEKEATEIMDTGGSVADQDLEKQIVEDNATLEDTGINAAAAAAEDSSKISFFAKYLSVWIFLAMFLGTTVGALVPSIPDALEKATVSMDPRFCARLVHGLPNDARRQMGGHSGRPQTSRGSTVDDLYQLGRSAIPHVWISGSLLSAYLQQHS